MATGFLNLDNEARERPVGLALDRVGARLIADGVADTVWRVAVSGIPARSGRR